MKNEIKRSKKQWTMSRTKNEIQQKYEKAEN